MLLLNALTCLQKILMPSSHYDIITQDQSITWYKIEYMVGGSNLFLSKLVSTVGMSFVSSSQYFCYHHYPKAYKITYLSIRYPTKHYFRPRTHFIIKKCDSGYITLESIGPTMTPSTKKQKAPEAGRVAY